MTYQPKPGDVVAVRAVVWEGGTLYISDAAAENNSAPWASLDEWAALGRVVAMLAHIYDDTGDIMATLGALAPLRERLKGKADGWD